MDMRHGSREGSPYVSFSAEMKWVSVSSAFATSASTAEFI